MIYDVNLNVTVLVKKSLDFAFRIFGGLTMELVISFFFRLSVWVNSESKGSRKRFNASSILGRFTC